MSTSPATADDRWQAGKSRAPSRSVIGAVLAGIAAFVSLFRVGIPAATDSLDGSWTAVLSWAFSNGLQFGSDIVFTYGPLGFLIPIANYHPQTFILFFAAQLFLGLIWALLVTRFAWRLPLLGQLSLALLLLAWAPMMIIDIGWYLMFVLAAVFVQRDVKGTGSAVAFHAVVLLALTLIALTKFTFLLLWLAFVGYASLQLLLARRWIVAAGTAAAATSLLLGLWQASGQRLHSLLEFFARGLEISSGYNASMGIMPPLLIDTSGVAILGVAILCLSGLVIARGLDWSQRAAGAFLLLALALTWKAGFIRADAHVCIFFGAASLISALTLALVPTPAPLPAAVHRTAAIAISLAGLVLTYALLGGAATTLRNTWQFAGFSLRNVLTPTQVRDTFQASWDAGMQRFDLPASRQRIGKGTVDLLMHEQGVVLLNRFAYSPRPAFQGYGAYSTPLARLNEAKLVGSEAPDSLLLKLQAIDMHLPGNEDPLSQLAALRGYAPVGFEKGYALLERNGTIEPIHAPAAPSWQQSSFGDEIPIPSGAQVLFYRVELSLLGKLYTMAFREPAIGLEVVDGNGATQRYRVARSLGDAGTLISPLLADNATYMSWYSKRGEASPRSLRFVARAPAMPNLFAARHAYAFQAIDLPRRDFAELPESARKGFYPGFSHPPRREFSPAATEIIRNLGEDVLFMHAPSHIDFVLPAGRWRAEGKFGLRADGYAPGACPQNDGTLLRVYRGEATAAADTPLLFSRQIDPQRVESDRGSLAFSVPSFASDGATPITFEFTGGSAPAATTACDWTFIGPLQFVPADSPAPP
jgi:hypothetical protein